MHDGREPVGSSKPEPHPQGVFYGWVVVAAVFMVTLVSFGSAYTFSAFVAPLQAEFGASRGSVALVFSIAGCLYFGLGVVSGPLADRWGARVVCMVGIVLLGAGLLLASLAKSIEQVYLAYGLGIGLGVGMTYVPSLGAVQRWFVRRRAFASGVAVTGIGVGTLLMPPLATWLIDQLGWRQAYVWLGAGALLLGLLAAHRISDDPRQHGTGPDGDALTAGSATVAGLSLREAVRTPRFAALFMASFIAAFGVFVPFVHLVPHGLDQGLSAQEAVMLMGLIGVGSTLGRFLLGPVADRWGRERFLICMNVGIATTLALWPLAQGFASLALFSVVFGLFYGSWVAMMPAVVAEHFGARQVSSILGVLYTSVALGTLLGPSAAGFVFDATNSYVWAMVISACSSAAGAVLVWVSSRTPSPMRDFYNHE